MSKEAAHAASHSAESKKKKRRGMNLKEKIILTVVIIAAVVVIVILILNMKILPAERVDENGNTYATRISIIERFKSWKPFVGLEGDLSSKDYDFESSGDSDTSGEPNDDSGPAFDDGLDLDQILEGQFTVLFLGLDEERTNTDVMMLALFDIAANNIHILQIPRDTFVPDYTSFEGGKINSVYTNGDPDKSEVQRVVDCIEQVFAIPIDRYVTTGCNDIVDIVDLIGGIPIDMPYTIHYEPGKTIYAGEQTLTGQQAEWMVRFRRGYDEGDIGRMKAQRIFLAAAMEKVCDIGTVKLMQYAKTIIDEELMGSNLSLDEISKLSDFATTIGMDKISMYMLPGEGTYYYPETPMEYDKYSVWSVHKSAALQMLNTYFRPYFDPLVDLPVEELVPEGEYQSTLYDNDQADLQDISDGDAFDGT